MDEPNTQSTDAAPRRFLCPKCNEEIEVLIEHFGQKVECSLCSKRFKADVRKDIKLRERRRQEEFDRQQRARLAEDRRVQETQQAEVRRAEEARQAKLQQIADPAEARTPKPARDGLLEFFNGLLYFVAVILFVVGLGAMSESESVAGLLCWVVGLMICLLVSLGEIRRTLKK